MAKKRHAVHQRGASGTSKRQKVDETEPSSAEAVEPKTLEELESLLFFDQTAISNVRRNIDRFDAFVAALREDDPESPRPALLLRFLTADAPPKDSEDPGRALASLFKCWSFAAQTDHDGLLCTIPKALATLVNVISGWISFRTAGTQVCRALLQAEPLACLEKCLKAQRLKAESTVECLRLLTEVVDYDGGVHARRIYRQREIFRLLETLLTMSRIRSVPSKIKDSEQPISVREAAIRFMLANFRHLSGLPKSEILGHGTLARKLFQGIENDSPSLIRDILDVGKRHVLSDTELTMSVKSRFVVEATLISIARLYRYPQSAKADGKESIHILAHSFLLMACLPQSHSHLTAQNGQAPSSYSEETFHEEAEDDIGKLHNERRRQDNRSLVKSTAIAAVLAKLRPHSSLLERSFTLSIFNAYPHLISEYFNQAKWFQFDPKFTATWIGYASFLFSVIKTPLPSNLSIKFASTSGETQYEKTVLESILPRPLQRTVLERCFTPDSNSLVSLLAIRLLLSAFMKLEQYLDMLRAKRDDFKETSKAVVEWFCQRCPRAILLVAAYRKRNDDSSLLNEQLTRLLLRYYSITPQLVSDTSFDVTASVATALEKIETERSPQDEVFQLQLSHLLHIAAFSPAMKWGNRTGERPQTRETHLTDRQGKSLSYSPFTWVLRTYVSGHSQRTATLGLIKSILKNYSALQPRQPEQSLKALIQSLEAEKNVKHSTCTFSFLDACFHHLFQHDLKYTSRLYELVDTLDLRRDKEIDSFSLLTITVMEQWPFFVAAQSGKKLRHVAQWVVRYLDCMDDIGESRTILRTARDEIAGATAESDARAVIQDAIPEHKKLPLLSRTLDQQSSATVSTIAPRAETVKSIETTKDAVSTELDTLLALPVEAADHPELTRWRRKDVSDAIDDGIVAALAECLASSQLGVRKQALQALRAFTTILSASSHPARDPLYLLLSELVETAASHIGTAPLPALGPALVATALSVLQDPLHILYPKLNDFLLQRPAWALPRLPAYWLRAILERPPTQPGAGARETCWLLRLLIAGLRTPADLALYRGTGTLERVLSRCAPGVAADAVVTAARHLVWRCTLVPGGSTMLVTRAGILTWLEGLLASCMAAEAPVKSAMVATALATDEELGHGTGAEAHELAAGRKPGNTRRLRAELLALVDRIDETADTERLQAWSTGAWKSEIARLQRIYG